MLSSGSADRSQGSSSLSRARGYPSAPSDLTEPFETVQQLRLALLAFKDRYNQKWLVERHGHRTPAAVRQALSPSTGTAA